MFFFSISSSLLPSLISLLIIWIYLLCGAYFKLTNSKDESNTPSDINQIAKREIIINAQKPAYKVDTTYLKTDNCQNNNSYFNSYTGIWCTELLNSLKINVYVLLKHSSVYLVNSLSRAPPLL